MDAIFEMVSKYLSSWNKRYVQLADLEKYVTDQFIDRNAFREAGGYQAFYKAVSEAEKKGLISAKKTALGNGRTPELKTSYRIAQVNVAPQWNPLQIVRVSDLLRMDRYMTNPALQSDQEWERIRSVYRFLQGRDGREWVTREERSFELFRDEKWLARNEGRLFLSRLGLTLEDLKAKWLGEPFVFWFRPGTNPADAKQALILENLSTFHSCKRILECGGSMCGMNPELLIYGEGKRIESSLPFLKEIVPDHHVVRIFYAGDVDPEGWGIYARIKAKHTEYDLRLAEFLYRDMLRDGRTVRVDKQQDMNPVYLEVVVAEMIDSGEQKLAEEVTLLWNQHLRIPQEVLTFERFLQRKVTE